MKKDGTFPRYEQYFVRPLGRVGHGGLTGVCRVPTGDGPRPSHECSNLSENYTTVGFEVYLDISESRVCPSCTPRFPGRSPGRRTWRSRPVDLLAHRQSTTGTRPDLPVPTGHLSWRDDSETRSSKIFAPVSVGPPRTPGPVPSTRVCEGDRIRTRPLCLCWSSSVGRPL